MTEEYNTVEIKSSPSWYDHLFAELQARNVHIIGISGQAGSGKSTLAERVVWRVNQYAELIHKEGFWADTWSLADPMKTAAQGIFGWDTDILWGPSELRNCQSDMEFGGTCMSCGNDCHRLTTGDWECPMDNITYPKYITPRLALQSLGTQWGRRLSKDIWIRALLQNICGCQNHVAVVPDVRFINEMEAIRGIGGKVWRIRRPSTDKPYSQDMHESEREQLSVPDIWFDHVIINDQDIEHLEYLVADFLSDDYLKGIYCAAKQ